MTTSTIHSKRSVRAFSLVEVMIAASISSLVLAGVMSTFLMLGRSGANVANYSVMEAQSRRALEEFSQDLRMASNVTWNSATSITLTVPNNYTATANKVTYAYDSNTSRTNPSATSFYRLAGDAAADALLTTDTLKRNRTRLISNVVTFSYARFDRINNPSTLDTTTKRIQLSMTARTTTQTAVGASNIILSASYILRNKYAN
jgi:Tfp pilus assembly protein PilW